MLIIQNEYPLEPFFFRLICPPPPQLRDLKICITSYHISYAWTKLLNFLRKNFVDQKRCYGFYWADMKMKNSHL